jgi:hypothetical protein
VGRPDLRAAFFEGYGRELADKEERSLRCLAALDAVSAISWGVVSPTTIPRSSHAAARPWPGWNGGMPRERAASHGPAGGGAP